ncbi:hypothetical protein BK816_01455 [Boudabousia tangfeifanii]|uniref:HTH lacI-type domain-containing protein n=1 Tax=Boudabousia tangfeifanii TaxID=1912795 RepID=A0A1D9MIK9_9ACTO|nr:LacI family DNA-binding transcriptional regulator [Boudabousia tangfeifanii]AOZ72124.1 hypothetical protein BK816_01455 [Boudabousia tangfeifanii]
MARANRSDVAKLAGVSLSTVSHVMNGRAAELGFSEETARKVREAAEQVGYVPRAAARAFRYQASKVIGLFLGEIPESLHLPVFNELLLSAIEAATEMHYFVLPILLPLTRREEIPDIIRKTLQEVELAGAIVEVGSHDPAVFKLLVQSDIPIVWLNPGGPASDLPGRASLGIAEGEGVGQMLERIPTEQIKRPVYLTGPGPFPERLRPFAKKFAKYQVVQADSWLTPAGYNSTGRLLADGELPDLIFAANDLLALGALTAARDLEVTIPHTIQLFSYGGFEQTGSPMIQLSTVDWPLEQMGHMAVAALLQERSDWDQKWFAGAEVVTDGLSSQNALRLNLASVAHPRGTTLRLS